MVKKLMSINMKSLVLYVLRDIFELIRDFYISGRDVKYILKFR